MRYIIYGAGAIGGLVGACLTDAGHDVTLIARGAHAKVMASDGLTVESPTGRRTVAVTVVEDPDDARLGPGDVVVLGMKSQDTPAALDALRRTAGTTTPVVCLQNGVDNERAALRVFDHVYGICVMCPAAHLEPGLVQVYSSPISGLLDIGRFPRGIDATTAAVSADLSSATFESVERTDIMRWKYSKLLMNLGNAVDALCRSGGRARLSAMVVEEGEACLRAAGISFTPKDEERARRGTKIDMHESETLKRRGGSSWQSLARATGRIESDYLNGEIVLLGRLHGVPTPANVLLQDLARQASRDGIPPGSFDADELLARLDRT